MVPTCTLLSQKEKGYSKNFNAWKCEDFLLKNKKFFFPWLEQCHDIFQVDILIMMGWWVMLHCTAANHEELFWEVRERITWTDTDWHKHKHTFPSLLSFASCCKSLSKLKKKKFEGRCICLSHSDNLAETLVIFLRKTEHMHSSSVKLFLGRKRACLFLPVIW